MPLGFCFAAVFLWLARPTWVSLGLSPLLAVRGVAAGYAVGVCAKECRADADGALCAYAESAVPGEQVMIAFRVCGGGGSWVILAALAVLFAVIYVPTIQGEEAYLRRKFAGFEEVMRGPCRVLLPRCGRRRGPMTMRELLVLKTLPASHREYNASMGKLSLNLCSAGGQSLVLVGRGVDSGRLGCCAASSIGLRIEAWQLRYEVFSMNSKWMDRLNQARGWLFGAVLWWLQEWVWLFRH